MASNDSSIDARESLESRYDLHYELLVDRARLSGALKASLVARFGHFAVLFGLFFIAVIAPSTLAGVSLIDYKALFRAGPEGGLATTGIVLIALFVLIDYTGRLLVRGLRSSLFEQLHEGTEVADDWRDHLVHSAKRLPVTLLVEGLLALATVLGFALFVVPGLYVLFIGGPVTHYIVARRESLGDGLRRGIAFAHRHRYALLPRFLFKIGWRVFLIALLAVGVFLINRFAAMYLPLTILIVGVLFVAVRPFILHFGLLREVAWTSTLQQLDGELELAEE